MSKKEYIKIVEVNSGVANRFHDCIEINKNLKSFNPKLYRAILRHELEHDDSTFSWGDLKHDLVKGEKEKKSHQLDTLKFMIKYPRALTQLLPFYYSRKRGFVLDINFTLAYAVLIFLIGGAIMVGLKFF